MLHIGLTGTNASGKTSIVKYLETNGFQSFSLSDMIRDELAQRNMLESRENLIRVGNQLREKFGPDVLARGIIAKLNTPRSVIDSIRNTSEVTALRTIPNFFLVGVDAPVETRFARAKERNRIENALTLHDFIQLEQIENSKNEAHQNLDQCMAEADYQIYNDGDLNQLNEKLQAIIEDMQSRIRLTWDEYFMKMAFLAAERSTCRRHHVGAIIVKERQVVSTGYNGAARGTKDCLELGCLRDELKIPSGERQEICRAIHAEQNAIIQAARHGSNIFGGTLYCTHSPCTICAKMIVNAGIKRIVICDEYPDMLNLAKELFQETGMTFEKLPMPDMKIHVLK